MATVHHAIPAGDRRKYILKDGVLQGSYALTWQTGTQTGGSVTYDATKKALNLTGQSETQSGQICTVTADVTNCSLICCTINNPTLGYIGMCLNSEVYPNQQTSSYIDVSAMTGNVTFSISARSTATTSYLKSIWME